MEGKSNSAGNRNHMTRMMGDVVVVSSPSPSPLHQQNFAGGESPRAASTSTAASAALEIAKSVVRMPTIAFEKVTHELGSGGQEESEEDLQDQLLGGNGGRRKSFRKRKKSVHGGGNDGNYMPPYKSRRMFIRRHISCPSGPGGGGVHKTPLKFLLGGNAHDPLNLNGLGDSDNAVTPKTSPMPFPSSHNSGEIPIMIPKNYHDPLRLLSEDDVENTRDVIEGILSVTPTETQPHPHPHKRRRHRRRSLRKRNESECSVESAGSDEDVEKVAAAVIAENHIKELRDDDEVDAIPIQQHSEIQPQATGGISEDGIGDKGQVRESSSSQAQEKEEMTTSSDVAPTEKEVVAVEREPSTSYPFRVSSDYIPLSSHYQPSPFVLDTMNENFTVLPFESPSMSNYMGTQDTFTITEPFSPPPRPMDVMIEHRVPSGHYGLGCTPPRNEIQRRQLPPEPSVQQQAMFNRRYRNRLDPIVSPVFPNLTTGKRPWASHAHLRHHHKKQHQHHPQQPKVAEEKKESDNKQTKPVEGKTLHKFHTKDKIFRFGNYNQYYGYRNAGQAEDARLRAFKREWIEGKDVLDIGCNVGHVTLCLGRDFGPRRILGIDIDGYLIKVAKKNVKHYVDRDPNDVSIKFPLALSIVHGSLQPPQLEAAMGKTPEYGGPSATPTSTSGSQGERKRILFPYNVGFRQENYVMEDDELLSTVKPQYDCIVCLSTTKWVHLNFGDDGLKRFFRRAFLNLRPGGVFVLEPQPWTSYRKKKKLTEEIFKTFQSIKFFPKDFEAFLLKEVGFSSVNLVGIPAHHSKGFQRPIYVFTKGGAAASTSKPPTEEHMEIPDMTQSKIPLFPESGGSNYSDCIFQR